MSQRTDEMWQMGLSEEAIAEVSGFEAYFQGAGLGACPFNPPADVLTGYMEKGTRERKLYDAWMRGYIRAGGIREMAEEDDDWAEYDALYESINAAR